MRASSLARRGCPPSRGRAGAVVILVSVGGWLAACSESGTGPDSGPQPAPNRPPAVSAPIPDREVALGDTVRIGLASHFRDPDGDALTFRAATSDPAAVTAAVAGGVVTVTALARGAATITVTASDPAGLEASLAFGVTVLNSGPAPDGELPDLELELGEEADVDVSAVFDDPDGDALAFGAASSDSAVAAVAADGAVITVRALARGTATIPISASDPGGLEASLAFEVTVPNSGPQPMGELADLELELGAEAGVDAAAAFADPDGDALAFRAASSDSAVASAVAAGGVVTVRALARGAATITVTAADAAGLEASLGFEVTVPNSGPAPAGELADLELRLGAGADVDVSAAFADPDGDALAFRVASSDPAVASAAANGGVVTVTALGRGAATITVTAADPAGLEASLAFEVTVPNSGPAPVGELADLELRLGTEGDVDVAAAFVDPDGDALAFRVASSDSAVASAVAAGGVVTVRARARGAATITVTASDPDGLEASLAFEVTIPNSGPAPAGELADRELALGTEADVDVAAAFADPDGDPLAFRAASSDPAVASAATNGGVVTVTALGRGAATIAVTAADPAGLEASLAFEVTVPNSGPAPAGELPDLELTLGAERHVDVAAAFADPDGDVLVFGAASSDPVVASAAATGSVVTVTAVARGTATITVTASDPDGLEASLAFEVTVPNSGPEPAGELPDLEVALGAETDVDVSAVFADPDGDALVFRAASSDAAVASATAAGGVVTVTALARGKATITVTAADPAGLEASLDFEVTVPNSAPAPAGELPDLEVALGAETDVDVSAVFADPDGDALVFRAASSDPGVASATAAGSVVTVRMLVRGAATITVTAADPDGLEASLAFDVAVPNRPPRATRPMPDIQLTPGRETTVVASFYFTDPDGYALVFRAASSDAAVASAAAAGGVVTVTALALGEATVTVTAEDDLGLEIDQSFVVTVLSNRAPQGTGRVPDVELSLDGATTVTASAYFRDPDGHALTYDAASSDPDVVSAETAGDRVTVTALRRGGATVTVTATDPGGLTASLSFEVAVPNRPPGLTAALPDLTLTVGDARPVRLLGYFSDPEGDPITFSASSSDATRASVATSGSTVTVTAEREGSARVTVRATDALGLSAEASFNVTIEAAAPPASYDIDIIWDSSVPSSSRSAIEQAVSVWEGILADSELADISVNARRTCFGYTTEEAIGVIDDLAILFVVDAIDGVRKVLGTAGPCFVRTGSGLPTFGVVILDSADLPWMSATGLSNIVLHEIAHVLGFGSLWSVTNPSSGASDSETVDTHFPGANAIAAFNAAGGTSYTGGKVPVANVAPGKDGHWRWSMFDGELMAPAISNSTSAALSAITIQALADLGYSVSAASADAFTVVLPDRPPGIPPADFGPMLPVGDDILRTEIRVVDENGRVVRVIPPR